MATLGVGSIVRAPRDEDGKNTGRAMIATIQDNAYELIWEDAAPKPLHDKNIFIISPSLPTDDSKTEETTMEASKVKALEDFEKTKDHAVDSNKDMSVWKDRGDTLLRLGDAAAAIPYYEEALTLSSIVEVGSTVLVEPKPDDDHVTYEIADVDCIDGNGDKKTADVVWLETGKESTIPLSKISIGISKKWSQLQVRTLLNLGRCLMHMADVDTQLSRPSAYRHAAAHAFAMSMTICKQQDGDSWKKYKQSAMLRKSKAHAGHGKLKAAMKDVKALLEESPESKEAQKWYETVERLLAQEKKADKKLVASMSNWIQSAMDASVGPAEPVSPMNGPQESESVGQVVPWSW
eukprot:CAMPEP_0116833802 /NCGR_PEP_ID=MMETSP0418-20121206/6641_1 /TAXON_ID=1158023 /ORGANISM="Astrosyne radiata, Strain 13vi08-1A" /LENGTH=348 /DNA_ID=CAMNT_0004463297 /DNA_START=12 /DNA_END=1055 /DNA_ORIENTATION=-